MYMYMCLCLCMCMLHCIFICIRIRICICICYTICKCICMIRLSQHPQALDVETVELGRCWRMLCSWYNSNNICSTSAKYRNCLNLNSLSCHEASESESDLMSKLSVLGRQTAYSGGRSAKRALKNSWTYCQILSLISELDSRNQAEVHSVVWQSCPSNQHSTRKNIAQIFVRLRNYRFAAPHTYMVNANLCLST